MTVAVMVALLCAALLCLLVPSGLLVRIRRNARGTQSPFLSEEYPDLLGVAYLRGGAGRVVDTVITAMHADGRVTVEDGRVTVKDPTARNAMERVLLKHCSTDWSNSLRALRRDMRRDAAVATIDLSLVKQGILLTPQIRRGWSRVADAQVAGVAVAAVVAIGLLFTPGFLPAALVLSVLTVAGIVVRVTCRPRTAGIPRTDHGDRLDRRLETRLPWSSRHPGNHPEGVAGVVAVHGTSQLPDEDLREQFKEAAEKRSSGSGSSSSSYASATTTSSSASCAFAVVGASCDGGTGDSGGSGDSGSSSGSSDSGSSGSSGSSSCSSGSSCSSSSSCSSCGGSSCSS